MCDCVSSRVLNAVIEVLQRREAKALENHLRFKNCIALEKEALEAHREADVCTETLDFISKLTDPTKRVATVREIPAATSWWRNIPKVLKAIN